MSDHVSEQKVCLVGISGPSSSGKTTLSRLLRGIIPNSFILHEDDFYKNDADIPVRQEDGIADWDCSNALDLPALQFALEHIKKHGKPPSNLVSKEDQNSVGDVDLDAGIVTSLRENWVAELDGGIGEDATRVAIVDGFLLFGRDMEAIRSLFDVRLFLRADYATVKRRREARKGYVTLEGFWEDPPGYVDKVVWPNYVSDHAYLFQDGDVNGMVKDAAREAAGIEIMPPKAQGNMSECLKWASDTIAEAINLGKRNGSKYEPTATETPS